MKTLTSLTVAMFLAVVCFGCNPGTSREAESSEAFPYPPVDELLESFRTVSFETEEDVRAAIEVATKPPTSVCYLHLGWSIPSEWHKRTFEEFVVEYHRSRPESPFSFHLIDCTPITSDYSSLYPLPGWERGKHAIFGNGEIMWMRNGRVVHVESILGFDSVGDLIEKTATLFADRESKD